MQGAQVQSPVREVRFLMAHTADKKIKKLQCLHEREMSDCMEESVLSRAALIWVRGSLA